MTKFSNEKVENLIEQEKSRQDTSQKQMRNEHLISLGLIDENKTERKYLDNPYDVDDASRKYDTETNKYYTERHTALDVTDEEYEEICKYFPTILTKKEILKTATVAEQTLNIIAIVVLVCGIIGALVCLLTIRYYGDITLTGVLTAIGVLLTSLTTWASLRVFCEIAINVRQINNKTK